MLKTIGLVLLLLNVSQAHAGYQCSVRPQYDVSITPQVLQLQGTYTMEITPDGGVRVNDTTLKLSDDQRQRAFDFQSALRKKLSWIDQQAQWELKRAYLSLDNIIVKQFGEGSRDIRDHLETVNGKLEQPLSQIFEHSDDSLTFHHDAIAKAEIDGNEIIQQGLETLLQDVFKAIDDNQVTRDESNSFQYQSGIEQDILSVVRNQETNFRDFEKNVCEQVTTLEKQRKELIKALSLS
ncbi:DUF2884 family protein [Serratia aquatilis]|uniref:DUF2884 family protein n=1 Tax=Serratia aquatilis TaxID=1737515 RepID=A0ABV6EBS9_9GAMM